MRWFNFVLIITLLSLLAGCKVYNQNILFQTKENIINNQDTIAAKIKNAEKNYIIQPDDYIEVRVFTAKGEGLLQPITPLDPNLPATPNANVNNAQNQNLGMMTTQQGGQGQMNTGMGVGAIVGGGSPFPLEQPAFHVRHDGFANLPVLGDVKLVSLTLHQADSLLKERYSKENLFQNCLVRTRFLNKRITVFMGNIATIYPLRNEKVTLFELLASVGGMRNDLRGSNIRLIRGDLRNPNVYVINLRTMEAYKQSLEGMKPYNSFTLEPNDIIYIEPVRKTFWEAFADVASPIATLASTTATVLALIAILRSGK